MRLTISPRPPEAVLDDVYPDSDCRAAAETPVHFRNVSYLKEMLDVWFASDSQVFVAANMFVYYVPGNRLKHVSPDLLT